MIKTFDLARHQRSPYKIKHSGKMQSEKLHPGICKAESILLKANYLFQLRCQIFDAVDSNVVYVLSEEGYHQSEKATNLRKKKNTEAGLILQMATVVNYGDGEDGLIAPTYTPEGRLAQC